MADAHQAAIADQEIEAHCENAINEHPGELGHQERAGEQGKRRQHSQHSGAGDDDCALHRAGFPKMPCGRHTSTTAISAYIDSELTVGNKILPNESTSPTSSAPTNAPL